MNLGDKKYYMGTLSLHPDSVMLKTLDDAVEDCSKYLTANPNIDERYIVKVVKIVRRKSLPVIIEDIE